MIQFEWFVYGAMFGFASPYVWPLIRTCWQEYQIARRDWSKSDRHY